MKIKYIALDQAEKILDYGDVPASREGQLQLISILGYTKVNGVEAIAQSSDRQVRRVAGNLFRDAEKVVNGYWKAVEEEEKAEEQAKLPEQYHAFLCDLFNIPESEREDHTISELEEQLRQ